MNSLIEINRYLNDKVGTSLRLYKGEDYFYFMAQVGRTPESIYTNSVNFITKDDLDSAIKSYKESL